nr:ribonuclease H-like domain-containing protein [Tanacetum cinerariifolium]
MVARFRDGTTLPTQRLNLHVSSVSHLPKSYCDAFTDPNWQNAMRDEYNALIKNNTWTLVPRPMNTNIVRSNGSTQIEDIDVDETFSPVVKPGTIWTPPGFRDSEHPDYVCLLQRTDTTYLPLYVGDIVLTASSEILLQQIIRSLHQEFAMTDLSSLNYFLGISVTRDSSGLFLSQKKYAIEILERAHMINCNPSRTPVDTESKLGNDGDPQVCLYMHDPWEPHFAERILRYVRGTLAYGLQLFSSSTTDLVAYSDSDWAGFPLLGPTLSHSNAEVEYSGVADVVAENCWLHNLLCELHNPLSSTTLVYCDSVSAVYLSCNPVQHQQQKLKKALARALLLQQRIEKYKQVEDTSTFSSSASHPQEVLQSLKKRLGKTSGGSQRVKKGPGSEDDGVSKCWQ